MNILGGISGAISGGLKGLAGGGGGSGGGGIEAAIGQLKQTFDEATANTAEITKVSTEGNVKKDAAAQRPREAWGHLTLMFVG